jgi:flagellar M-ring protein FliF
MDFVNKAFAQLNELFRSMTPGVRLTAGLLLALIVVSLFYLFQYRLTGGDEFLLDGRPFSSSEIAQIEAAFAQAGLKDSTVSGNRIRIPRGQKDQYLAALADNNALPADFYHYLDEASAADNPFTSSRSQELRRWNAKQKELALIISRMRGIETATVQFDEESKGGLQKQKHKTAMVALQTLGGELEESQLKAIRNVVASAYAGLDRQNITITDMTSGLSYGGSPNENGLSESESLYAAHKQKFERDWQRKIADQLAMIPNVVVGVNVELSPELQHSTQTVKLDPKPVTLSANELSKESNSTIPNPAGRPGAVPNGVGNQPVAVTTTAAGAESSTSETSSQIRNLPGHEQTVLQKAPLVPTKVTASIDVPSSYLLRIYKERNPTDAGKTPTAPDPAALAKIETETINKIKETVRNLLPPVAQGTDPYPHITVSTYVDLPGPSIEPPTTVAAATSWLAENWRTVAMILVGLASLLMLRSMVRSSAGQPTPAPAAQAAGDAARTDEEEDEADTELAATVKRRFQTTGPNLRVELQELVKEDPDTAANILRSWIGDAA